MFYTAPHIKRRKAAKKRIKINKNFFITLSILLVLIIVVILISVNSVADRVSAVTPILESGMLRIGLRQDLPNFAYSDENGEISGYEADIANEISKRLLKDEVPVEIVYVNSKSARVMLLNNEIDFALGAFFEIEDTKISYSAPYYTDKLVFLTNGVSKLSDGIIGIVTESYPAYNSNLKEYLDTHGINAEIKEAASVSDALFSLNNSMLTAVCSGKILLSGVETGTVLPDPIMPHGYCVMLRSENTDLISSINEIIDEMKSDGTIKSLISKWSLDDNG